MLAARECEFQVVGEASMRVVPKSAFLGVISLSDPKPVVHRVTIKDKAGVPEQIKKVAAEFETSPLTVTKIEGDIADEDAIVDIHLVANDFAKPGVQFSRFYLLTESNGESIRINFDIGVEFK